LESGCSFGIAEVFATVCGDDVDDEENYKKYKYNQKYCCGDGIFDFFHFLFIMCLGFCDCMFVVFLFSSIKLIS